MGGRWTWDSYVRRVVVGSQRTRNYCDRAGATARVQEELEKRGFQAFGVKRGGFAEWSSLRIQHVVFEVGSGYSENGAPRGIRQIPFFRGEYSLPAHGLGIGMYLSS